MKHKKLQKKKNNFFFPYLLDEYEDGHGFLIDAKRYALLKSDLNVH